MFTREQDTQTGDRGDKTPSPLRPRLRLRANGEPHGKGHALPFGPPPPFARKGGAIRAPIRPFRRVGQLPPLFARAPCTRLRVKRAQWVQGARER